MTAIRNSLYFVGIDIGSEYSGLAFTSYGNIRSDPMKCSTEIWQGGSLLTLKCPTAILLDDNEEIVAFGYEAETRFLQLLEDDEHHEYYYFKHFRNDFLQSKAKNPIIKDVSGKPLEALKVISQTINFFKSHVKIKTQERIRRKLVDEDFYFVLTVPATWDDQERDFMKKAAVMADIKENKICIASEPDAASLFCLWTSSNLYDIEKRIIMGEKYMVIDLGARAKITCHGNDLDVPMAETINPSGGPLIQKSIDEAFYTFLTQICGRQIMESFKSNAPEDYLDLFRKFEIKQRIIRYDQTNNVVITLSNSLIGLVRQKHKNFQTAIEKSPYNETVRYSKQLLHISADTFRGFFEPTINAIIKHIKTVQKEPHIENINILMMVGGFSECELVQNAMHSYFGQSKTIVIPDEPGIVIMKSAAMFIFYPAIGTTRIGKFTYGVKCCSDWDSRIHTEEKKELINGKSNPKDIFCKLSSKGDIAMKTFQVSTKISVPNNSRHTFDCFIFASTNPNPRYTTNPECKQMLHLPVKLPITDEDNEIEVALIFTRVKISVTVRVLNTEFQSEQYMGYPTFSNTEEEDSILNHISQMNAHDFKDLISKGDYASYENRVYLAGACNIGKSSLASILIGDEVPKKWYSTDGLVIHFGRNGIHLEERTMIPLVESDNNILKKMLLGIPNIGDTEKEDEESSLSTSISNNVQAKPAMEPTINVSSEQADKDNLTQPTTCERTIVTQLDTECFSIKRVRKSLELKEEEIPKLELSQTADAFQSNVLQEIRDGKYKIRVAPSDLIDFGGQRSFDMTHQLFIQHKGTFVLMFDGRYGLNTRLKEYSQGNITAKDILVHWVNSILIYCSEGDDKMPMILFAATHSDIYCADEISAEKHKYIGELTELFQTHNQRKHILNDRLFFINATDLEDLEIELLKDALVDIAFQQPTWGQRMPVAWVPLELQIFEWRAKGINIIAKEEIKKFNESNPEFMLSAVLLEAFLKFQHSLGKIMYIDQFGLQNFIIIEPTAMVNILRSFVTDKLFWPKNDGLRRILEGMAYSGMVEKKQLLTLWSQPQLEQLMPSSEHKEYIIQVLVHLDILVEPKRDNKQGSKCDTYLVPCIVNSKIPDDILTFDEHKTICMGYKLTESIVPTALSFKLIGAAVSTWPLKEVNGRNCLYYQSAIMHVDENNELLIEIRGQTVVIYLTNRFSKYLISPDVAASIQECLTLALKKVLIFYHECFGRSTAKLDLLSLFEIEVGEMCKRNLCLLPLSQARQKQPWTCTRGKKHETKYCLYWAFDRETRTCDTGCKGLAPEALSLTPNDQHLMRLAKQLDMQEFEQFFINLGMKRADLEEVEHRFIQNEILCRKLMALYRWKKKNYKVSLQDLLDGLKEIERSHYLCQIVREETSLFGIAESRLQSSPSDEVLEQLSRQLGNCVIQLSIELGLSFNCIEETMYRYPKDMYGQIYDILKKWKQQIVKPSIHRLMMALQQVECGGVRFLQEQYK